MQIQRQTIEGYTISFIVQFDHKAHCLENVTAAINDAKTNANFTENIKII